MDRIQKSREAYLKQDVEEMKRHHTKALIRKNLRHHEEHRTQFNLPEIILGGQDGLVNVLGVILGVAAATSSTQLVIIAGLAAAFAESVSMAAVAYTSKIAEADYYQSEYEREKWEIEHAPEAEREEVRVLYQSYGFKGKILEDIVDTICSDQTVWLRVMMEQELKLEPVRRSEALSAAVIVGISAIVGSFIPLTPYFFMPIEQATVAGLAISAITLFAVGFYKAKKTLGRQLFKQGMEMMIIGMVSALVGYFIGTLFKVPPM